MIVKRCAVCGKEFETYSMTAKTCSLDCKSVLMSRRASARWQKGERLFPAPPDELRRCLVCGKEFVPGMTTQRCCSTACSKSRERSRQRKAEAERRKKAALAPQEARPDGPKRLGLAEAERLCRSLGISYGQAAARAMDAGIETGAWLAQMAIGRAEGRTE